MTSNSIILFDGVCNLCNGFVNFVIDRDKSSRFRFGSLQSPSTQILLNKISTGSAHQAISPEALHTVILIEGDKVYTQSTAALRILRHMDSAWPLMYGFVIIPRFLRDLVYNFVARNRYRWFGKREYCRVPTPELKSRFID